MTASIRYKSGYYSLLVSIVGILFGLVIYLALNISSNTDLLKKIDLNFLSLGSAAAGIAALSGTFIFDKLSSQANKRLKWFLRQPFIWQLAVFLLTAFIMSGFVAALLTIWDSDLLASISIGLNISYTLFEIYLLYKFLKMIFKQ